MADLRAIPGGGGGLAELWERTRGDERICVAVVDGRVDRGHPAFRGAALTDLPVVGTQDGLDGRHAAHGTHVASVIFGQPKGPVPGVASGCRGLCVPAFSEHRRRTSQLELARGIELAAEYGAHVINVSGGQLSPEDRAQDPLARAVAHCRDNNVLVIAAAGNNGCFCNHVPAALESVLAVGALDDDGQPLAMSNWGPAYRGHGILAPGANILVASPGGRAIKASGTSRAFDEVVMEAVDELSAASEDASVNALAVGWAKDRAHWHRRLATTPVRASVVMADVSNEISPLRVRQATCWRSSCGCAGSMSTRCWTR